MALQLSQEKEPELDRLLNVQDWGMIDYPSALRRQMDLVDLVSHELSRETLVFCSHPAVVTTGRGTQPEDLCGWQGDVIEVNRGGRATYHGPSQIVVYPILDLNQRGRDLHKYMRSLEAAVVATLLDFGITAVGRAQQTDANGENQDATGVWIAHRKVASIGIGVRRWVSFHGLALNLDRDESAFVGLRPCGFSAETMISVEEARGARLDREQVKASLRLRLTASISQDLAVRT